MEKSHLLNRKQRKHKAIFQNTAGTQVVLMLPTSQPPCKWKARDWARMLVPDMLAFHMNDLSNVTPQYDKKGQSWQRCQL